MQPPRIMRDMTSQQRMLIRGWLCVAIIICSTAIFTARGQAPAPVLINLSGNVSGGSGKHVIFVALWQSDGFLKHPVQQVRIEPHAQPHFQFQVAIGRWAVSAFEDLNDNGILDMGAFGPKEPSGFWHPFHKWRKPRFEDVAVQVDQNRTDIDIKLNR
jgi:uncharacterized protein (DUF2141 family)